MTLDLSCDSFRIVINNGFMLWNLKLCETSADTSGPFTHTWRKNTPSDALTLHLIAACEAHWIKSNLKIWKDCQLHLKSAQLPVLNVGILLLCKPRIRRLYMSYTSYQYIWADCSACECHDDQGFAEILKWARQLPSHKPLINHCVSTFVSRNPLVLLPVVLVFFFWQRLSATVLYKQPPQQQQQCCPCCAVQRCCRCVGGSQMTESPPLTSSFGGRCVLSLLSLPVVLILLPFTRVFQRGVDT